MNSNRIAYLGPSGTYTEQAALIYDPKADLKPYKTFGAVLDAIKQKQVHLGVIAIENMIHGMVRENLDLLYQLELYIQFEVLLPIHHVLATHPNTSQIDKVIGHPQALAQCRKYLRDRYPDAVQETTTSTAAGFKQISEQNLLGVATIGSEQAASQHKLKIMDQRIEDFKKNVTRFWVIGRELLVEPNHDKISVTYFFEQDRPGCLYDYLGYFAQEDINLVALSVRPSTRSIGNYIFHVDFDGNLEDERIQRALDGLRECADIVRVMGSYKSGQVS